MEQFLKICIHNILLFFETLFAFITTQSTSIGELAVQYQENTIDMVSSQYNSVLEFMTQKQSIVVNNTLIYGIYALVVLSLISVIFLYLSNQNMHQKYSKLYDVNKDLQKSIESSSKHIQELVEECKELHHRLKKFNKKEKDIDKLEKTISVYRKLRMNKAGYFIFTDPHNLLKEKIGEYQGRYISENEYLIPLPYFKDFDVKYNKSITV